MQIRDLSVYRSKIPGTRELVQRIPGVRGEIKDRNGRVLATNKPSYEVIFDLRDITSSYKKRNGSVPKAMIPYKTASGATGEFAEADIVRVVNETVVAGLEELQLDVPYSKTALRVHYRTSPVVPWTYRRGLEFDEFARFAEHNLGLPGVSPTVRPVRHYVYDSLCSHVLGYVKLPEDGTESAEDRKKWDFYVGDDFGVRGIEKTRDGDLRGQPGVRTLLKNEKGVLVGEVDYEPSRPGSDVHLTIDLEIQYIVEQALRDAGIGRGSAVVIDPNNGDVLSMVSVPSFNPNQFIPNISRDDWKNIERNPTQPLNNKAVQQFPPGSTYKVPIALGGCLGGVQNNYLTCNGKVYFGRRPMRCWIDSLGSSHGSIDLSEALKRSCNCYFYQFGNQARIENLNTAGRLLGLGQKTGIDLDVESSGILPGRAWLKQERGPNANWTPALTALMSIGQGDVLATPIQMAAVTATVANGGTYYPPCLVDRIVDPNTGRTTMRARRPSRNLADEGIEPWKIEKIRKGMLAVVNAKQGGTGTAARIDGVQVAGKTGTAQAWRDDPKYGRVKDNKAWFIAFAPYDAPQFAVCVLVEGGTDSETLRFSGGGTAAPVARRIIERSLALRAKNYYVNARPIKEADGHFRGMGRVEFKDEALASEPPEEVVSIEPVNEGSEPVVPRAIPLPSIPASAAPSLAPSLEDDALPMAIPLPRAKPVVE